MRPRRCRQCHVPATHVEITQRPECRISRDGVVTRWTGEVHVFWCPVHFGE